MLSLIQGRLPRCKADAQMRGGTGLVVLAVLTKKALMQMIASNHWTHHGVSRATFVPSAKLAIRDVSDHRCQHVDGIS